MRVGFAGLRPRAGMAKPARIAGLSQRSNLGEIAVAALALRKARGTRRAFLLEDPARAGPFGAQAFPLGEALLQQHRTAIGAQAGLREARDLMRKRLGDFARLAGLRQALAKADAEAFVGGHLAAGQNNVERPGAADDPRQAHRAAV